MSCRGTSMVNVHLLVYLCICIGLVVSILVHCIFTGLDVSILVHCTFTGLIVSVGYWYTVYLLD